MNEDEIDRDIKLSQEKCQYLFDTLSDTELANNRLYFAVKNLKYNEPDWSTNAYCFLYQKWKVLLKELEEKYNKSRWERIGFERDCEEKGIKLEKKERHC